jgi:hypothetical protein
MSQILNSLGLFSAVFFGLLILFLLLRLLFWNRSFWHRGISAYIVEYLANAALPRKNP